MAERRFSRKASRWSSLQMVSGFASLHTGGSNTMLVGGMARSGQFGQRRFRSVLWRAGA